MNTDIMQGQWKQLKGKVQQKWGELTNDELDRIAGKREELVGIVQEKYGRSREEAEREVNDFLSSHTS